MSHSYTLIKATADTHRAVLLSTSAPVTFTTIDLGITCGQSNEGAAGANPSHGVSTANAFGITRSPQPKWGHEYPLQSGTNPSTHFGASNKVAAFAANWYALTGRKSGWCNIAVTGTPLVGGEGIAAQWDPEPYATSLVGGYELIPGQTRYSVISEAIESINIHPKLERGLRVATWCGGEADAGAGVTKAVWKAAFHRLIDYMKAEFGIDYMLVYGIGRFGADASEVATNAAARAEIRSAQEEVCAERSDTFMAFNQAQAEGDPFNTLTVDGNGYWESGWTYYDGQHWDGQSQKVAGHTGALNIAIQLGLTSGSTIGI